MTTTPTADFTAVQKQWIANIDSHIQQVSAIKEMCQTYELGNIYTMKAFGPYDQIDLNSTGEPHKYKVVHISPTGVAFLQRLSSANVPYGDILLPPEIDFLRYSPFEDDKPSWQFVQDPDQLNAIMLQQEYDPMKQHNEKLQLKAEIDKHNKSILVPTSFYDEKVYIKFLKNLKLGDKFWTSIEKQYVVHEPAARHKGKWFITVLDIDQQQVKFNLHYFSHRRLYKDKPRSFAKEVKK